jgi:hypothetical protein
MPSSKSHPSGPTFKEKVEIAQAIVTIVAVFVGGLWTYDVFIKERRAYPHANIEHKITHLALSEQENLLRVGLDITNAGSSLMAIQQSTIRVQQILPPAECETDSPCAPSELREAAANSKRKDDRFTWPLIGERIATFEPAVEIEPGERQNFDFEFITPREVKAVRIYTYIRNEQEYKKNNEEGWAASSYYDFPPSNGRGTK